jgi:hypothetical protein
MTDHSASSHWTDEQFSDYVLGATMDREVSLHLETCAVCREELDRFQESVLSFNQVSMAWSERRSDARASDLEFETKLGWLPTVAWAMAAGLAVAVGLPMALNRPATQPAVHVARVASEAEGTQIASVGDENSAAAIERDNKLMMAVAVELNSADPTPVVYGARTPQGAKAQGQAREN